MPSFPTNNSADCCSSGSLARASLRSCKKTFQSRELYRSAANGDRWSLIRDCQSDRIFIEHEAVQSSGEERTVSWWHRSAAGTFRDVHAHDPFVIAVFEQGAERFEASGAMRIAAKGSVLVIPPAVSHRGSAATPVGWTYRAFYPPPETVLELRTQQF
jgi:hypothetical protein